jgi:hypothetical protein
MLRQAPIFDTCIHLGLEVPELLLEAGHPHVVTIEAVGIVTVVYRRPCYCGLLDCSGQRRQGTLPGSFRLHVASVEFNGEIARAPFEMRRARNKLVTIVRASENG